MNQDSATGPNPAPEPTVIGIGASAGGLQALRTFLEHVPIDSGLAFVVVVHLSPEHESHMADLLRPHVEIPVEQVTRTLPLAPNHVYIIPPGQNLNTIDTHLRLSELEEKRSERAPIDHFFRTLAETHDGHAVAVVLTGTGTDGTMGLKRIKERGGLTIVQDPEEAEYDGMPRSAIASGLVDRVLPVAWIPAEILRIVQTRPRLTIPAEGGDLDEDTRPLLQKIFTQIRARTGRDFSRYKRSTIMRRIQRHMQLRQTEQLEDYLGILRNEPTEVRNLTEDLLITVTGFFRDPAVFQGLEARVIPALFQHRNAEDTIRVWSVGCATGEEAYSLAILLLEAAAQHEAPPQIQVFASDLHEASLQKAREGYYPGAIDSDVSAGRLRRFFTQEGGGYRIRKEVRELVVFTPHNLLADPPFSRIDLLSCRNLLIYLQRDVQREVLELFHYALNPEGFLLLGSSETVDRADLFQAEDKRHCLYRRRNVPTREPHLPVFPLTRERFPELPERPVESHQSRTSYQTLHQELMLCHAPPSLLLNPEYEVVHLTEQAGRYLRIPGGELSHSVFQLLHPELRIELRALLHAAGRERRAVHSQPLTVDLQGEPCQLVLHVYPATMPTNEGYYLVVFEARGPVTRPSDAATEPGAAQELEAELDLTRERMQHLIEEYEAGREEMKAAHEEFQSTNEELRSTMEELETSKEELQSMNEELSTLNQENRYKVEELGRLSSDLQNLLVATDIATLFLDRELCIQRFTPRVEALFNMRDTDRGRQLSDLTHRLGYDELHHDAQRVLERLTPLEREVRDDQGRWYLTRLLPYRSTEDRIEGVVITFVEITRHKQAEAVLGDAQDLIQAVAGIVHEPLLVLDPNLRVVSANDSFYRHFQVRPEDTQGRLVYDLGNGQWNIPELRRLLDEVLPNDDHFDDYRVVHEFEGLGKREMCLNGRRLDHLQMILLAITEVSAT